MSVSSQEMQIAGGNVSNRLIRAATLVSDYCAARAGLQDLGVLRSAAAVNGQYAEWLAAHLLDLRLAPSTTQKAIDAVDKKGRTYQIKERTVDNLEESTSFDFRELSTKFDWLLCVFLSRRLDLLGLLRVPYAVVKELCVQNGPTNFRFRWHRTVAQDKRLERLVWRERNGGGRVPDIDDARDVAGFPNPSPAFLGQFTQAKSLLRNYFATREELRRLGILRSDADLTGAYAEWLVAELLHLRLSRTTIHNGIDASDQNGRTYQIKARTVHNLSGSTSFSFSELTTRFDWLVCVFFSPVLTPLAVVRIPYSMVIESVVRRSEDRARFNWSQALSQDPRVEVLYCDNESG